MKKTHVQLTEVDRQHLRGMLGQHKISVKVHRRATALAGLGRGPNAPASGQGGPWGEFRGGGQVA